MSNKTSNYPTNAINTTIPREDISNTITCLLELGKKGKPQTLEDFKERFNEFNEFCVNNGFKPAIESLCVALNVTRTTFWNWCRGDGCSREIAEMCLNEKQLILAFVEQASLSGKLNPATSIFLLKNIGGYKDAYSFEETTSRTEYSHIKTLEEIKAERENITNAFDFTED